MNKKTDELRNSNFNYDTTKYKLKQSFADTMEKGYFSSGKEVIEKALGGKGIGMTISQTLVKCMEMGEPGSQAVVDFQNRVHRKYRHKIFVYDDYRKQDLKTKFSEDVLCLSMTGTGFVYNTIKKYNSMNTGDEPDNQRELEIEPTVKQESEEKKKQEVKKETKPSNFEDEDNNKYEYSFNKETGEIVRTLVHEEPQGPLEIEDNNLTDEEFYERYGYYEDEYYENLSSSIWIAGVSDFNGFQDGQYFTYEELDMIEKLKATGQFESTLQDLAGKYDEFIYDGLKVHLGNLIENEKNIDGDDIEDLDGETSLTQADDDYCL